MGPGYDIENAEVVHETKPGMSNDGAILVRAPDFGNEEVWIPKSQITEDSEVYKAGTEGTLIVTEFFAGKKGWT